MNSKKPARSTRSTSSTPVQKDAPKARRRATTPPAAGAAPRTRTAAPRPTPRKKAPAAAEIVPPPVVPPRREVTSEDIRVRAYFLSLEHHGNGRSPADFWLQAERELRQAAEAEE